MDIDHIRTVSEIILKTAVAGADLSDFALFSLSFLAKWSVKQP